MTSNSRMSIVVINVLCVSSTKEFSNTFPNQELVMFKMGWKKKETNKTFSIKYSTKAQVSN